jgi:lipoprotein-releasing system permease protein
MVQGFTLQIKDRIFGFWGHAEIVSNENNDNYEPTAIQQDKKLIGNLLKHPNIAHISEFVIKSGILKTKKDIEGIVLKGVNETYDWTFLQQYITAGNLPRINKDSTLRYRDILLSTSTANRLNLKIKDKIVIYFIQKGLSQPIGRKFEVCGLYHTGLEEYDIKYALTDMNIIRQMNKWSSTTIHGYEIKSRNWRSFEPTVEYIYRNLLPNSLDIYTIREKYPNIFDWLTLQNRTSSFTLFLLLVIAIFNVITAFMLIIIDNIKFIGVFKSLGSSNRNIKKIFIYQTLIVVILGMTLGNILGLGLCMIQQHYGIIHLNEENYYFSVAPIEIQFLPILLINIIMFLFSAISLFIPSSIITRITPVKILRFE